MLIDDPELNLIRTKREDFFFRTKEEVEGEEDSEGVVINGTHLSS